MKTGFYVTDQKKSDLYHDKYHDTPKVCQDQAPYTHTQNCVVENIVLFTFRSCGTCLLLVFAMHCGYTPAHSSLFLMAPLLHFKDTHVTRHRDTSSRSKKIQVVFKRGSDGGTGPSVGEMRKTLVQFMRPENPTYTIATKTEQAGKGVNNTQ